MATKNEILDRIMSAQSPTDFQSILEGYYPGWIIWVLDAYSPDYPHLQKNWEILSSQNNVKPQKIILVEDIKFDPEHEVINKISEYMTRKGYCVRRATEFIACEICEKAIPSMDIWHLLKEKKFPIPAEWSRKCRLCR
jgi:hypothetical protein